MAALRLYLLRHAKSSIAEDGMADFDRPLSKRGRRQAADVAEVIAAGICGPACILCSSSLRTRETLTAVLSALSVETEVVLTRLVYEASGEALMELLRRAGGDSRSLVVIGHNPAIEELAGRLAGGGDLAAIGRMSTGFPPAALAVFDVIADGWDDVQFGAGELVAFHTATA